MVVIKLEQTTTTTTICKNVHNVADEALAQASKSSATIYIAACHFEMPKDFVNWMQLNQEVLRFKVSLQILMCF